MLGRKECFIYLQAISCLLLKKSLMKYQNRSKTQLLVLVCIFCAFFGCRSVLSAYSHPLPSTSGGFQSQIPTFPSTTSPSSFSLPSTSADLDVEVPFPTTSKSVYLPTAPSPASYCVVEVQKKVKDSPPPPSKDPYTIQIEVSPPPPPPFLPSL